MSINQLMLHKIEDLTRAPYWPKHKTNKGTTLFLSLHVSQAICALSLSLSLFLWSHASCSFHKLSGLLKENKVGFWRKVHLIPLNSRAKIRFWSMLRVREKRRTARDTPHLTISLRHTIYQSSPALESRHVWGRCQRKDIKVSRSMWYEKKKKKTKLTISEQFSPSTHRSSSGNLQDPSLHFTVRLRNTTALYLQLGDELC